jgi:hypothetical protein
MLDAGISLRYRLERQRRDSPQPRASPWDSGTVHAFPRRDRNATNDGPSHKRCPSNATKWRDSPRPPQRDSRMKTPGSYYPKSKPNRKSSRQPGHTSYQTGNTHGRGKGGMVQNTQFCARKCNTAARGARRSRRGPDCRSINGSPFGPAAGREIINPIRSCYQSGGSAKMLDRRTT